ncbi:11141_t:CDS:2 [Ambispora gerdemannii]|uniref:11141_t:CDS:1 n=1 Tax=Ambispora gerdemannii TaxID=144530 RepID=A0A9N8VXY8_9GLOM|nr:11141_t:CDS:2 [Ambispora gerdemannii]
MASTKKNSSSPILATEILQEIFKYIRDLQTLFSCLLVNRQWCRTVIPILWRDPFEKGPSPTIIQLYVRSLPESARCRLKEAGINQISDCIGSTIFEYPSLLKRLRFGDISNSINAWLTPSKIKIDIQDKIKSSEVLREILTLILQSVDSLDELIIEIYKAQFAEISKSNFVFPEFDGVDEPLKNIRKLHFKGNYLSQDLWKPMTEKMTEITHFRIDSSMFSNNDQEFAANFIKKQKNLAHLCLSRNGCWDALASLAVIGKSIRTLCFFKLDFEFIDERAIKGLKACINLRAVDLEYCLHCDSLGLIEAVKTFQNLKYFACLSERRTMPTEIVKTVLETSGNKLEFLFLNPLSWDTMVHQEIIDSLITNGQTLKFLELSGLHEVDTGRILSACPNLIDFIFCAHGNSNLEMMTKIAKTAPPTLRHLRININGHQMSIAIFRIFLENLQIKLESFHVGAPYPENLKAFLNSNGIKDTYPPGRVEVLRKKFIPTFGLEENRFARIPEEFGGR